MTSQTRPLIRLHQASKGWYLSGHRIDILKSIDLAVFAGTSTAIMGPSGSGKSTLLHVLGLLTPLDTGELSIDGKRLEGLSAGWRPALRHDIGFVFQDAKLIPELSVMGNVCVPLVHRGIWPSRQKQLALEALTRVGLADRPAQMPNQLSGGEMMRVAIARAVVQRPRLLLADEPTGNLDSGTAVRIIELLMGLVTARSALVFVTHNQELTRCANRVLHLRDGRIETAPGTPEEH